MIKEYYSLISQKPEKRRDRQNTRCIQCKIEKVKSTAILGKLQILLPFSSPLFNIRSKTFSLAQVLSDKCCKIQRLLKVLVLSVFSACETEDNSFTSPTLYLSMKHKIRLIKTIFQLRLIVLCLLLFVLYCPSCLTR